MGVIRARSNQGEPEGDPKDMVKGVKEVEDAGSKLGNLDRGRSKHEPN